MSAGVLAIVVIAGCGGGGDSVAPAATRAATATAGPAPLPSPSATAVPDDAAAIAAVAKAYVDFFDGAGTTVDEKVALLQDGELYRTMLEGAAANPQGSQLTADVSDVAIERDPSACSALGAEAPCARVVYTLLVAGMPMAVEIDGVAIMVDGAWMVAAAAWCHVVEIGGETCP